MRGKKIIAWCGSIVAFLFTLVLAELPPFGSSAVALCNGGYGTFDMTTYDIGIVNEVLANTLPENFSCYYHYYICDFLFVIAFAILQLMISTSIHRNQNKALGKAAIVFLLLRGLLDSIENVILLVAIYSYPNISETSILISNIITRCKFYCMGIWILLTIIGVILLIIRRKKH